MKYEDQSMMTIRNGDYYEDCFFHPCLCVSSEDGELIGVSLVDGSFPRSCHVVQCGVRKLTLEEAMHWKFFGPIDRENGDLPWVKGETGPCAAVFKLGKL